MPKNTKIPWVTVDAIRVANGGALSQAEVGVVVDKLERDTRRTTTVVARRLAAGQGPELYELVSGRREYEATRVLGRTHIPCRILPLTDDQAASVRDLDGLVGSRGSSLRKGWVMQEAAERHDWSQADLVRLLPACRSTVSEAMTAAAALPRVLVEAAAVEAGIPMEAVCELERTHLRKLKGLPEDERREALRVICDSIRRNRGIPTPEPDHLRLGAGTLRIDLRRLRRLTFRSRLALLAATGRTLLLRRFSRSPAFADLRAAEFEVQTPEPAKLDQQDAA